MIIRRNSHSTWGFSSACTTCASEAKRCWERSWSYSSQKTLESNKSVLTMLAHFFLWHLQGRLGEKSASANGVAAAPAIPSRVAPA